MSKLLVQATAVALAAAAVARVIAQQESGDTGSAETYAPGAPEANSYDVETLARTIYGEARGQGQQAMEDVAAVIMNRRALRVQGLGYASFGGPTVAAVCTAPSQFSCWNAGDPNLAVCRQVTTADPVFRTALDIAQRAVAGLLVDRTGGADHYYATLSVLPSWAHGLASSAQDGAHTFFKIIGG